MKILVTGAEGQLGMAVQRVAATGGDFEWLFTDVRELDITDRDAVEVFLDRSRPDVVVNLAAFTDVDRAQTERAAAFSVNRDAPRFLAHAAAESGAALVHISTDFVFDGRSADGEPGECPRPWREDDAPAPLNVYGESKLAGERAVAESGVRGAIVRTSWLYSPWGRNFVRSILDAAAPRATIRVVADQTGCPTSAASLAGAIVRIIPSLGTMDMDVWHFCDAGAVSRAGFAAEIIGLAGLKCRVVPVSSAEYPLAAVRPAFSALDTSKISRTFGIVPPPWRQALAGCIKEILNGC